MCSGCFGEYEGDEYDEGDEHNADEACIGRRPPSDENEFEILVGAEQIVEIRWIQAAPGEAEAWTASEATAHANRQSNEPTAKNYQTQEPLTILNAFAASERCKWLLITGLALVSAGEFVFLLLRR